VTAAPFFPPSIHSFCFFCHTLSNTYCNAADSFGLERVLDPAQSNTKGSLAKRSSLLKENPIVKKSSFLALLADGREFSPLVLR
jgi:hypothetical protein